MTAEEAMRAAALAWREIYRIHCDYEHVPTDEIDEALRAIVRVHERCAVSVEAGKGRGCLACCNGKECRR